jgi:hypothetical protein
MRGEVRSFAESMERKLQKRDGYGGWRHLPLEYLREKLQAEVRELEISLKYEPTDEVMNECVDVANFCMFIYDILASGGDDRSGLVARGGKEHAQSE